MTINLSCSTATDTSEFVYWREQKVKQLETWLLTMMPVDHPTIHYQGQLQLWNAMRYSLLGQGKRFRALLVYTGGSLSQANESDLNYIAGAIEAIHAYSLVHDDLPCMDNDDLRRGRPTCHKVYGEAIALLVGDALHALSFEWLLALQVLPPNHFRISSTQILNIFNIFTQAIGYQGMVGGQAIDIAHTTNISTEKNGAVSLELLQSMHQHKTGALIAASLSMGYMAGAHAEKSVPYWLTRYAAKLGLLFQVVDDYLDATETSVTLGKTAGKDAKDNKGTYVNVLGLEETRTKINELKDTIEGVLKNTPLSQAHVLRLRQMMDWVITRHQ